VSDRWWETGMRYACYLFAGLLASIVGVMGICAIGLIVWAMWR